MPSGDGGLGSALVGEKLMVNQRQVAVTKLLGEGGFSYVYLTKEVADTAAGQSLNSTTHNERPGSQTGSTTTGAASSKRQGSVGRDSNGSAGPEKRELVLKVTSIVSRHQREIAEKEAKLLSRLSHPSIIKMVDTCYRTPQSSSGGRFKENQKERPQHLILMEFCDGGSSLDVCEHHMKNGTRFDLSTLIIAFGQICNAVSYLHAQRPPIVHRDLKPDNFLVKAGAYKLCDFGSAVFGHVKLESSQARNEADEVIEKTTTQMFRAPEMVDLFSCKKLTQATDVWALGACLYSLAYLQNCFEEGSNLAILSNKYQIPDDNPYGEGLVDLIDRMLTIDVKARADMTEVILCLSAVYAGRPLPPRKEKKESSGDKKKKKKSENAGKFNASSQGVVREEKAPVTSKQSKKIDPNSVAGRRLRAAGGDPDFNSMQNSFGDTAHTKVDADAAFSTTATDAFANFAADNSQRNNSDHDQTDMFGSLHSNDDGAAKNAFKDDQNWTGADGFASFSSFAGDDLPKADGDGNGKEGSDNEGDADKRFARGRRGSGGRKDSSSSAKRSKSKGRSVASLRAARPRSRARGRQDPDGRKELQDEDEVEEEGVEETLEGMRRSMSQMDAGDDDDARRKSPSANRRTLRRTMSGGEGLKKSSSSQSSRKGSSSRETSRSETSDGKSRSRSHSMDVRKRNKEAKSDA